MLTPGNGGFRAETVAGVGRSSHNAQGVDSSGGRNGRQSQMSAHPAAELKPRGAKRHDHREEETESQMVGNVDARVSEPANRGTRRQGASEDVGPTLPNDTASRRL